MIMEETRHEQAFHLEELWVVLFGSLSSFGGAVLVSCCFIGRGRRLRNPRGVSSLAPAS